MVGHERPSYLLLLPPPPRPANNDTLRAAYSHPISTLLQQLTQERRKESTGSVLEIALPCPVLANTSASRSALYAPLQQLVAGVYSLICAVAATEAINVEDVHGIDIRVLLLAYSPPRGTKSGSSQNAELGHLVDTVVPLQTLARCGRPWVSVFAVESEEGEELLRQFVAAQTGRQKVRRVPGGVVQVNKDAEQQVPVEESDRAPRHLSVAVGGTFDHIHLGHKLLLTMFAFLLASSRRQGETRSLTVGLTGDEMLKNKKYPELLESYDDRQKIVNDFMRSIMDFRPAKDAQIRTETKNEQGPNGHAVHTWLDGCTVVKCVELSDPFGPTITDKDISGIVVSGETRSGGKAINDKRKEKGWAELEVLEVDVLDSGDVAERKSDQESFDAKLSSTTIRKMLSEKQEEQRGPKI